MERLKVISLSRRPNETFGFVIASSNLGSSISSIQPNTPASNNNNNNSFNNSNNNNSSNNNSNNNPSDSNKNNKNHHLNVGDRIERVNNHDVEGMTHNEIVNLIRTSGLHVTLTVSRHHDVALLRDYYHGNALGIGDGGMVGVGDGGIGGNGGDGGREKDVGGGDGGANDGDVFKGSYGDDAVDNDADAAEYKFSNQFYNQGDRSSNKSINNYNNRRNINNIGNNINNNIDINDNINTNDNINENNSYNNNLLMETYHHVEIERSPGGFGFTISGGREFEKVPLSVLKITPGGSADLTNNLKVGDGILEINGQPCDHLSHTQAVQLIQLASSSSPPRILLYVKRSFRLDRGLHQEHTHPGMGLHWHNN